MESVVVVRENNNTKQRVLLIMTALWNINHRTRHHKVSTKDRHRPSLYDILKLSPERVMDGDNIPQHQKYCFMAGGLAQRRRKGPCLGARHKSRQRERKTFDTSEAIKKDSTWIRDLWFADVKRWATWRAGTSRPFNHLVHLRRRRRVRRDAEQAAAAHY